ncbi:hypothetical protein [Alcanivorax sp.]|jgi:hypothetical protein|uniref:head-tail joining protein n=1 Tax=Alcanivorax sp. TaxID=1872427 RepID=UPI0030DD364C
MSQFDGYKTALDGAVFNFYGDPATITAGPLKPERGTSPETVATLDYDDVRDDMNALIATLIYIEYPKAAWPYPRRGDKITMKGKVWTVHTLERDNDTTLVVEVTQ